MGIRNTYIDLYTDIRKKKYFLVFTTSIFLLAAALSILRFPELKKMVLEAGGVASQENHNRSLLSVIVNIFAHNAAGSLIVLFSGVLCFILPISAVIANGYVAGCVVIPHLSLSLIGLLIPHGVFELPALILTYSYGIWLGLWPFNRDRIKTVKLRLKQCTAIYFCGVVPLLIIGATIEGILFKYMLK